MSGSCEEHPPPPPRSGLSPRRALAWPGLGELRRREAALESEWGELQEQGFGYREIHNLLLEELEPAVRAMIVRSVPADLTKLDPSQVLAHF